LSEGKVAFIVRRHCHDGAGAVAHENVISNPQWYGLAGEGVDCTGAERDACFFFGQLSAFKVGFFCASLAIG